MSFFSKKINSEEFEKLLNKINELKSDISAIKADLDSVRTNQNSLRGIVNRRLHPEENKEEVQKGLNTGFPF